MDEAFPFRLPPEPELLVLVYATDRDGALEGFRAACGLGQLHLARRLAALFGLTSADVVADGNRALSAACMNAHQEVVDWLVSHFGLTVGVMQRAAILCGACACGDPRAMRWLVSRFAEDIQDNILLYNASMHGHLGLTCWLSGRSGLPARALQAGDGHALLRSACMHIRPGVAQWLAARFDLSAKDVRADAGFALAYASEAGRLRQARWLADHFELTPADARADDNCALAYASMWGHQEIARWLIVRFGRPINNGRGSFIKVHVREYGYRKLADWMEAVAGSF